MSRLPVPLPPQAIAPPRYPGTTVVHDPRQPFTAHIRALGEAIRVLADAAGRVGAVADPEQRRALLPVLQQFGARPIGTLADPGASWDDALNAAFGAVAVAFYQPVRQRAEEWTRWLVKRHGITDGAFVFLPDGRFDRRRDTPTLAMMLYEKAVVEKFWDLLRCSVSSAVDKLVCRNFRYAMITAQRRARPDYSLLFERLRRAAVAVRGDDVDVAWGAASQQKQFVGSRLELRFGPPPHPPPCPRQVRGAVDALDLPRRGWCDLIDAAPAARLEGGEAARAIIRQFAARRPSWAGLLGRVQTTLLDRRKRLVTDEPPAEPTAAELEAARLVAAALDSPDTRSRQVAGLRVWGLLKYKQERTRGPYLQAVRVVAGWAAVGRPWIGPDLEQALGLSPSTTSDHLARMVRGLAHRPLTLDAVGPALPPHLRPGWGRVLACAEGEADESAGADAMFAASAVVRAAAVGLIDGWHDEVADLLALGRGGRDRQLAAARDTAGHLPRVYADQLSRLAAAGAHRDGFALFLVTPPDSAADESEGPTAVPAADLLTGWEQLKALFPPPQEAARARA